MKQCIGSDLKNADENTPFPASFLDFYTETKMMQEKVSSIYINCYSLKILVSNTWI